MPTTPIERQMTDTAHLYEYPSPRKSNGKDNALGSSVHLPLVETDFAEYPDGSLIDLVEDPKNPKRTVLAVWKDGDVSYYDRLQHEGQMLIPVPRNGEILKCIRLPRGTKPYASSRSLLLAVADLIRRRVSLKDEYLALVAHFVLSTWLADRLPVAPYLSVVGLPQSGKTTLLKILSLVSRRPLLTADISSAAFYRACAQLSPTLLIDEGGTFGDNRSLRHLLRMGTTRDVVAMRKHHVFHAYGPKVISWLEPPDDPALNSRCVQIEMTESNNPDLDKSTDSDLEEFATDLQAQLLQFRFENYKKIRVPKFSDTERLRPRSRDLLACLAAPCGEDVEVCQPLVQFFKSREIFTKEPLPPPQSSVLTALFSQIHQNSYTGLVLINDLTAKVNYILEKTGQPFRLRPRKVGAILTTFGFSWRKRTNTGWTILLDRADQERVHKLARVHGIDFGLDQFVRADLRQCPLCQ